MLDYYLWIKSAHVISVIAWMAGMLYLPRLFVYHCDATVGSDLDLTLKVMERRLMRGIINPSMIAVWIFGIWMLLLQPTLFTQPWFHVKLTMVVILSGLHGFLSKWRKGFERQENTHSSRFYRFINEVPAVLMVVIVIMVIARPF